jgi:Flp pilus assembly protein TadG
MAPKLSSRGRRGQALTELAMVIPILLLMVVGIMEFGRAWALSQIVTDAARQGARKASLLDNSTAVEDSVHLVVRQALEAGNITFNPNMVEIVDGNGTNTPVTVTVRVPYDFGVFRPVFRLAAGSYSPKDNRPFNDGTITLRSTAVMRNE